MPPQSASSSLSLFPLFAQQRFVAITSNAEIEFNGDPFFTALYAKKEGGEKSQRKWEEKKVFFKPL